MIETIENIKLEKNNLEKNQSFKFQTTESNPKHASALHLA